MISMQLFETRERWLDHRRAYIGGSDVAAIVGLNPYKTNIELWREKTGRSVPEDISDKPAVRYGNDAEGYLRELFKLDHPELEVSYVPGNSFLNDRYPFAAASLDGWLKDEGGRSGILEIKTCTINGTVAKSKWEDRIPDNYYCQVCFYMGVCDADFTILKAQLKYEREGEEPVLVTKHYRIEREDAEEDIKYIMVKAAAFYEYIKEDKEPPLTIDF